MSAVGPSIALGILHPIFIARPISGSQLSLLPPADPTHPFLFLGLNYHCPRLIFFRASIGSSLFSFRLTVSLERHPSATSVPTCHSYHPCLGFTALPSVPVAGHKVWQDYKFIKACTVHFLNKWNKRSWTCPIRWCYSNLSHRRKVITFLLIWWVPENITL